VAKLVDSIPVTAQEGLETYLNEDLRRAVVSDSVPVVDDDGKIFLGEIILRLEDGREVAIVPEMRGMYPWLSLEIHDGQDWRGMSVAEDYAEELEELTAGRGARSRTRRRGRGCERPPRWRACGGEPLPTRPSRPAPVIVRVSAPRPRPNRTGISSQRLVRLEPGAGYHRGGATVRRGPHIRPNLKTTIVGVEPNRIHYISRS
jgi:hypothetical protein